jgi:hypothetical protein
MDFKLHPLVLLNISDHHTRCVLAQALFCVPPQGALPLSPHGLTVSPVACAG